jgi:hypothetical protein
MISITRDQIRSEIHNFSRDLEDVVNAYAQEVQNDHGEAIAD